MTPATSPARSCKVAPSREPQLLPTPRILIEIVWNPPVTSARARRSKYPVLQPAFASNTTGAPKPQSVHSNVASPTSMLRCCCIRTSAPACFRHASPVTGEQRPKFLPSDIVEGGRYCWPKPDSIPKRASVLRSHSEYHCVHVARLCRMRSGAPRSSACLLGVFPSSYAEHHFRFRGSCRSWNASRRKLLQSDPLVNEQPPLPADAAAVSGETSISADDAVAWNHNGNRVCGTGQGDRADGFRAAQLSRQRPIAQRCTGLDRSEC